MSVQQATGRAPGDTRRHILLAVEESDNSRRAVMFVADFFGSHRDVLVTLLSILPEPPEDMFDSAEARERWLQERRRDRERALEDYRKLLAGAGLGEARVATRLAERRCVSIGEAILEEQDKLGCCIVVVGRRGLSHHEEFIFGSTSNRILHHARRCAVLVVQ